MAKTLEEYAAAHPIPEPARPRAEGAGGYSDYLQRREQVQRMKDSIAQQLQQGAAPQTILYTAIKAIGILTADDPWSAAALESLDSVYADLAQQSMLADNDLIAAQRLDAMREQFATTTRRQLYRQQAAAGKLQRAITEALQALEEIEPEETK